MQIVKYPNPVLAYPSKPIRKIDQGLRDMATEMLSLMYENEGVGLAANQVGLPYQFFVMNPTCDPEKKDLEYVFINPVILKKRGRVEDAEGCLSFPDLRIQIYRAEEIIFQAVTLDGTLKKYTWKGFEARIVQHETDHLHGHCFYERAGMAGQIKAREILQTLEDVYESNEKLGFTQTKQEFIDEMERLEKERT